MKATFEPNKSKTLHIVGLVGISEFAVALRRNLLETLFDNMGSFDGNNSFHSVGRGERMMTFIALMPLCWRLDDSILSYGARFVEPGLPLGNKA